MFVCVSRSHTGFTSELLYAVAMVVFLFIVSRAHSQEPPAHILVNRDVILRIRT
jgi:hypothetical protein